MKKKMLFGSAVLSMGLLLAGCGDEEASTSKNSSSEEQTEATQNEAKVKVMDKKFYLWTDESIGDMEQLSIYTMIKNTGKTTVDISNFRITSLDKDGSVIQTDTSSSTLGRSFAPSVLKPGQVSYIGLQVDPNIPNPDIKDIQVDVNPTVVDTSLVDITELKVKNGKANVDLDNWGGTADVTGLLQNHSKKDALNVEAGAGVFDKDNNFLGALFLSSDETITLGPTQSTGLQLGFPGIPSSEVKKIDHVDFSVSNVEYDVQD
jgi:archaellum component FlaG (FlaF/FlaG flagellin family)